MKTMKYHEFDILIKYVFENNPPKVCKLKPSRKIADTKIKKANLELRLLIKEKLILSSLLELLILILSYLYLSGHSQFIFLEIMMFKYIFYFR